MKHYLFIFCLFCGITVHAQELSTNFWAVKWVHTSIVTPIAPHLRFAVEKRWNKLAVNAQAGWSIPVSYVIDNTKKEKTSGYASRLELRNYGIIRPVNESLQVFLGAEIFYLYKHNKADGMYTPRDENRQIIGDDYNDEYVFSRTTWGAVGKFGLQYSLSRHVFIEVSLGAGPKVVNNVQQYRDNLSHFEEGYPDLSTPQTDDTFTRISVAFPVLCAIGYKL